LCKGGDYTPEAVVGATTVTSWGGRVEIIPFVKGFSTSALIQKLNAL
jgi:bifunctional ADP-heptose synthase (sugar kinase/adenylyltransferase)